MLSIARSGATPIYGRIKDKREDALSWLNELGDPYVLSVSDLDGRVGIDYGVYGAPETFLIDRNRTIRLKHIGPLTPEVWQEKFQPLLKDLNK